GRREARHPDTVGAVAELARAVRLGADQVSLHRVVVRRSGAEGIEHDAGLRVSGDDVPSPGARPADRVASRLHRTTNHLDTELVCNRTDTGRIRADVVPGDDVTGTGDVDA